MQDLLTRYGNTVIGQSGIAVKLTVDGERRQLLTDADCVIYAGDCMLSSRFHQDRTALSAPEKEEKPGEENADEEEDPGLTDQARVNGGVEGLLHTLRQGNLVADLCELMREVCPRAIVITLGQPVARTVAMFRQAGFRCYGFTKSPMKGPGGLEGIGKKLRARPEQLEATIAGLPDFAWLLSLRDIEQDDDLLPVLEDAVRQDDLGRLAHRWLDWYEAVPVGDVIRHAEFLPAQ